MPVGKFYGLLLTIMLAMQYVIIILLGLLELGEIIIKCHLHSYTNTINLLLSIRTDTAVGSEFG